LFVSREIVAAHGGTITATSRIGDGTTISVRLPAAPRPPKSTPGTAAAGLATNGMRPKKATRAAAKPRKRVPEGPPS
jgi:hypothetical protein